jgi:phosphate transport system permease protein
MAVVTAPTTTTSEAVARQLKGTRSDVGGKVVEGLLLASLLFALLILLTLLAQVVGAAANVFSDRGLSFLTDTLSQRPERAGVRQGIMGSFTIAVFVILVAFPIGIGASVYLEEYAKDTKLTRFITLNVRNLAGVPSVVYGLLGLAVFVQSLRAITGGPSVISGGLTIALLVLPIVIITASEAIRAVPSSIREAGYGVGATRWEVVRSHVLPYAAPGILTGTVLALARALGEAAPLLLIGAVAFYATGDGASLTDRLQGPFTAMPDVVYNWATDADAGFADPTKAAIFVMLFVVLTANATAILLRNRFEKKRS